MLRELKILLLLIIVVGIIYWGVEPLAHSIMHPKVAPADYEFKDLDKIDLSKGDAQKGKKLVTENCTACHGIKAEKINPPMDNASSASSYGVVPPDLSNIAAVLDHNFLANFIKNPVKATELSHKFGDSNPYPMPGYDWMSDDEISDIVAYLASIASKNLSDKDVFTQACDRCHSIRYDKMVALTPDADLERYLGTKAPDLSMMIRSRGPKELSVFINNPQKMIPNTPMPRVGLTQQAEKQVISYLEKVGDSKKAQRDSLGIKIMIFFAVMALLAYAWKRKIWSDLH
ncbi:c-type cytochrome [Helicobacter cappadocius]|uniref:C-type cytochrome n=1 Tax=Helicobacter cappadocius TaxID=3063998 RepID=A0AA90TEH2_9HELI|nr:MULTISPECIES: c-type cytochrome [unclassified Helicobacter]MDO7252727.1 c-type cytochrome [Helicobacter sp. faydin-H75]MDP2538595.1 c-type cytochrome [Helicobacter sp. faydin-H76]